MKQASLSRLKVLQNRPLITGLVIACIHWLITYLLSKPTFLLLPSCSDILTIILIIPGLCLLLLLSNILLGLLSFVGSTTFLSFTQPSVAITLLEITLSSFLYGLAVFFLLSQKKLRLWIGVILFLYLLYAVAFYAMFMECL